VRRNFFLIVTLLFCSAFSRSTTFDDREICEQMSGVWRQFGNSCVDECEAKLNELAVCTRITVSACECGKSRCWSDEEKKCVALLDYKKTYDLRVAEEKKINEEAKKKREVEAAESEQSILNNLTQDKSPNQNNVAVEQQPNPAEVKIQNPAPAPEVTNVAPVTPPAGGPSSAVVNNPPPVPPMFLQQEQEKNKQEEQKKQQEEQKTKEKKKDPEVPLTTIPGLPVIPLPQ
jgi:hypothetical protein